MSTVFESISLKGLRLSHLRQLASYIEHRDMHDQWYYGNRMQFEKRHKELLNWIQSAVAYAESPDVVFPKVQK